MKAVLLVVLIASSPVLAEETLRVPGEKVIRAVGMPLTDPDDIEFVKAVLTSLDRKFTAVEYADGITIYWQPKNKAQEQEVSTRLAQYVFVRDVCRTEPLPKPTQAAKASLSC